jgi:predicted nucleic acid-binding protein
MADFYFDSSALVKRYVVETGSARVSELLDLASGNEVIIVAVTPVEMIAAIARRVRGGTMTLENATTAFNLIRSDVQTGYQVVELTDAVIARAMRLAERHALRGYDAVQLAGALEVNALLLGSDLPPITFVSADAELNGVAVIEGLPVENPNHYA